MHRGHRPGRNHHMSLCLPEGTAGNGASQPAPGLTINQLETIKMAHGSTPSAMGLVIGGPILRVSHRAHASCSHVGNLPGSFFECETN